MVFVQSTPQTYVNALKAENVEWPVKYDDIMPYESDPNWFWSGFFSSRPAFKKQVKDSSAILSAHSKIFARKVIDQKASEEEIKQSIDATQDMLDSMGIAQHHDAITGTANQWVANDYSARLSKSIHNSRAVYN